MNTPTHLLIGAAVLARRSEGDAGVRRRNLAVLIGALLPDLSIFVLFFWARVVQGVSERELWSVVYWREPWQTLGAIGNSIPLFCVLALIGLTLRWRVLTVLALAALLHLAFDLPFHADDAHRHFWPLTDWRFFSPLSYWDADHHGNVVAIVEAVAALGLVVLLWRRFASVVVRVALGIAAISYVAVPAYFIFMLGSAS